MAGTGRLSGIYWSQPGEPKLKLVCGPGTGTAIMFRRLVGPFTTVSMWNLEVHNCTDTGMVVEATTDGQQRSGFTSDALKDLPDILRLQNVSFVNNSGVLGGGLRVGASGTYVLTEGDVGFVGNHAYKGSAIYLAPGNKLNIKRVPELPWLYHLPNYFINNTRREEVDAGRALGSAIYVEAGSCFQIEYDPKDPRQYNIFRGNYGACGGALHVEQRWTDFAQVEFLENLCINTDPTCELYVPDGIYEDNGASEAGGAVCVLQYTDKLATVWLHNNTFSRNSAPYGGAVFLQGADNSAFVVNVSRIANNTASLSGGGVWFSATTSSLEFRDSRVEANSVQLTNDSVAVAPDAIAWNINTTDWAAGANSSGALAKLLKGFQYPKTFGAWEALGNGGGILGLGGTIRVKLNRTVVSSNTVPLQGGGMYCKHCTVVELFNSTIEHNVASSGGGILLHMVRADSNLVDSILRNNTAVPSEVLLEVTYIPLPANTTEPPSMASSADAAPVAGGGAQRRTLRTPAHEPNQQRALLMAGPQRTQLLVDITGPRAVNSLLRRGGLVTSIDLGRLSIGSGIPVAFLASPYPHDPDSSGRSMGNRGLMADGGINQSNGTVGGLAAEDVLSRLSQARPRRIVVPLTALVTPASMPCGPGCGGGMCASSLARQFRITNMTLVGNKASLSGGGMYVRTDLCGKVDYFGAVVGPRDLSAIRDGPRSGNDCQVQLLDVSFLSNTALCSGSAFYVTDGSTVTFACSNRTASAAASELDASPPPSQPSTPPPPPPGSSSYTVMVPSGDEDAGEDVVVVPAPQALSLFKAVTALAAGGGRYGGCRLLRNSVLLANASRDERCRNPAADHGPVIVGAGSAAAATQVPAGAAPVAPPSLPPPPPSPPPPAASAAAAADLLFHTLVGLLSDADALHGGEIHTAPSLSDAPPSSSTSPNATLGVPGGEASGAIAAAKFVEELQLTSWPTLLLLTNITSAASDLRSVRFDELRDDPQRRSVVEGGPVLSSYLGDAERGALLSHSPLVVTNDLAFSLSFELLDLWSSPAVLDLGTSLQVLTSSPTAVLSVGDFVQNGSQLVLSRLRFFADVAALDSWHQVDVSFKVQGWATAATSVPVFVRQCLPGEIQQGNTCKVCSNRVNTTDEDVQCVRCEFSYDPSRQLCDRCPENGDCNTWWGVPRDGFWASHPRSTLMHACPLNDACAYAGRRDQLMAWAANPARRFGVYSDAELAWYDSAQCAPGYTSVLCGGCAPGYARLKNSCSSCDGDFPGQAALAFVGTLLLDIAVIGFMVYSRAITGVTQGPAEKGAAGRGLQDEGAHTADTKHRGGVAESLDADGQGPLLDAQTPLPPPPAAPPPHDSMPEEMDLNFTPAFDPSGHTTEAPPTSGGSKWAPAQWRLVRTVTPHIMRAMPNTQRWESEPGDLVDVVLKYVQILGLLATTNMGVLGALNGVFASVNVPTARDWWAPLGCLFPEGPDRAIYETILVCLSPIGVCLVVYAGTVAAHVLRRAWHWRRMGGAGAGPMGPPTGPDGEDEGAADDATVTDARQLPAPSVRFISATRNIGLVVGSFVSGLTKRPAPSVAASSNADSFTVMPSGVGPSGAAEGADASEGRPPSNVGPRPDTAAAALLESGSSLQGAALPGCAASPRGWAAAPDAVAPGGPGATRQAVVAITMDGEDGDSSYLKGAGSSPVVTRSRAQWLYRGKGAGPVAEGDENAERKSAPEGSSRGLPPPGVNSGAELLPSTQSSEKQKHTRGLHQAGPMDRAPLGTKDGMPPPSRAPWWRDLRTRSPQFRYATKGLALAAWHAWLKVLVSAMVYYYPSLTSRFLSIFSCVDVDDPNAPEALYPQYQTANRTYWTLDYSTVCFEGRHMALVMGLGVPGLVLFTLGCPIFLVWILHSVYGRSAAHRYHLDGFVAQHSAEQPRGGEAHARSKYDKAEAQATNARAEQSSDSSREPSETDWAQIVMHRNAIANCSGYPAGASVATASGYPLSTEEAGGETPAPPPDQASLVPPAAHPAPEPDPDTEVPGADNTAASTAGRQPARVTFGSAPGQASASVQGAPAAPTANPSSPGLHEGATQDASALPIGQLGYKAVAALAGETTQPSAIGPSAPNSMAAPGHAPAHAGGHRHASREEGGTPAVPAANKPGPPGAGKGGSKGTASLSWQDETAATRLALPLSPVPPLPPPAAPPPADPAEAPGFGSVTPISQADVSLRVASLAGDASQPGSTTGDAVLTQHGAQDAVEEGERPPRPLPPGAPLRLRLAHQQAARAAAAAADNTGPGASAAHATGVPATPGSQQDPGGAEDAADAGDEGADRAPHGGQGAVAGGGASSALRGPPRAPPDSGAGHLGVRFRAAEGPCPAGQDQAPGGGQLHDLHTATALGEEFVTPFARGPRGARGNGSGVQAEDGSLADVRSLPRAVRQLWQRNVKRKHVAEQLLVPYRTDRYWWHGVSCAEMTVLALISTTLQPFGNYVQLACSTVVIAGMLHMYGVWRPINNFAVRRLYTLVLYTLLLTSFLCSIAFQQALTGGGGDSPVAGVSKVEFATSIACLCINLPVIFGVLMLLVAQTRKSEELAAVPEAP
ncbi:hypothetical protein HYH03_007002 [Edaphochlamys debaryana]|uniref:Uncharacterized protein n=1 Tax=Edaphochlamys debaryana TaxID=47281 RepID=A0A836C0A7_9CHLO|nr:hypothetical protein HYH03_007002 [Edaphochlamys debaryana]|eukprot:KAG2494757.1 hypothetical protein HYH03_007002 [Edaphochlamys debaryana]